LNDFEGQDICVLGGTGTIGNALIERLLPEKPSRIRCVSNDEYSMWQTEQKFGKPGDGSPVRYVLKDIRNRHAIREVLRGVDILYMVAAYKHVQYVEYSPLEAIDVNVVGNANVIDEALANTRIQKVVNISTDKVCYPHSTYGLSKALIEKVVEWASFYRSTSDRITAFANTRFGNVIGSRGSVLEKWFDPDTKEIELRNAMHRRFFMQTNRAIDLVLKCTLEMKGGETFIFKMPVARMGDVAEAVSRLTGKDIVVAPEMQGETDDQWLLTLDESAHRKEDDFGFILHKDYPAVEQREYSTRSEIPLTQYQIMQMLKEWVK